jgi:hypothetical protein
VAAFSGTGRRMNSIDRYRQKNNCEREERNKELDGNGRMASFSNGMMMEV